MDPMKPETMTDALGYRDEHGAFVPIDRVESVECRTFPFDSARDPVWIIRGYDGMNACFTDEWLRSNHDVARLDEYWASVSRP